MKPILYYAGTLACSFLLFFAAAPPAEANSRYAAYVMHADSGNVLFDRYSTARRYPASLTKVMTLYMLFERMEAGTLSPTDTLDISARAAGQPASRLGVKAGTTISVDDAVKALIVRSANDVAVVVAENLSGSEWKFAREMTEKARSLGMKKTVFRNASGLPNRRQVTTARDMALMTTRILQDFPQYFHYFRTTQFNWKGRTYHSHNRLVSTFEGATGLKTGYTKLSGYNLVTTAERDGNRLIGVVLGGRSGHTRDAHMRKIMNAAFAGIRKKPSLIAALHREKPSPRMKPRETSPGDGKSLPAGLREDMETLGRGIRVAESRLASGAVLLREAVRLEEADTIGLLLAAVLSDSELYGQAGTPPGEDESAPVGEGDLELPPETYDRGIQIGAYSSRQMAERKLEQLPGTGGTDIGGVRSVTAVETDDGKQLYRARITGLTEDHAGQICQNLLSEGLPCLVLSSGSRKNG